MGTTAQNFYPSNTDQDQSWGSDVDKLLESVPGVLSTTIAAHPNSAGTTDITLDPYTSRSTQGDARTTFGWAWNESTTDGMQSVSGARRLIPAGTWHFQFTITIPTGGTLTGSHNVTMIVAVYRVDAGGGITTSPLFTLQSAEVSGTAIGTTVEAITVSGTAGAIVLEPGETLHVGVISRNRQVAGSLGATTAGNITWHTGNHATAQGRVQVPSPGIRTLYDRSHTDSAPASDQAIGRFVQAPRAVSESIPTTEALARQGVLGRGLTDTPLVPVLDSSGNGKHGLLLGGVSRVASPAGVQFGHAAQFDGVNLAGSSATMYASPFSVPEIFTLELRVRRDRLNATEVIAAMVDLLDQSTWGFVLYWDGTMNTLGALQYDGVSATDFELALGNTYPAGTVLDVVLQRDGSNLVLFVDGKPIALTGCRPFGAARSTYFTLARYANDTVNALTPYPFQGVIDEVRLSSVARYPYTGAVIGTTLPTSVASPWGAGFGNAVQFDGVDRNQDSGGIQSPRITKPAAETNGTLECKVRRDRLGATEVFCSWFDYWKPRSWFVDIYFLSDNRMRADFYDGSVLTLSLTSAGTVATGTHDVALVWDTTTCYLFLDGAVVASAARPATLLGATERHAPLCLGRLISLTDSTPGAGEPYAFQGVIDEVRLSNVARYTSAYTPATMPFTEDVNTQMLMHLDSLDFGSYTVPTQPRTSDNDTILLWHMDQDNVDRRYSAYRALAESLTTTESLARLQGLFRRLVVENSPTTGTLAASFAGVRSLAETVQALDSLSRQFVGSRALSETLSVSSALTRTALLKRGADEAVSGLDTLDRSGVFGRDVSESVPTTSTLDRQINVRRFISEYPTGVAPDYTVEFPERKVDGFVYDPSENPVEGAVVKLFRMSDDKMVQETVSDENGYYLFLRDLYDPNEYYVLSYLDDGEPQEHGVSDRGFAPEPV